MAAVQPAVPALVHQMLLAVVLVTMRHGSLTHIDLVLRVGVFNVLVLLTSGPLASCCK